MSGNGVLSKQTNPQKTSSPREEIAIIKIRGYLDMITAEQLDKAIMSLLKAHQFNIIVDLQDVEYISSSGWGVFLGNIKEIREKGGDLKLTRMKPDVFEVYKVLEFFWFIKSYAAIDEAVYEFDQHISPMAG